ncbi:putative membrane-associated, metal-dependent hydrolase [Xanthomonas hortorum ATCC 19865]|nr:putative membrane-associated, metal-dependent hydrolase [Xanthomonas hortorum ATCC 19865]
MQDYDTAMIYVSDHGESLGEKGLYLHGVPYAIAPKEQTHVPVMCFSPEFARDRGLDETCLRHRAGQYTDHDALFPSILGLMQVKTSVYASAICLHNAQDERSLEISQPKPVRRSRLPRWFA